MLHGISSNENSRNQIRNLISPINYEKGCLKSDILTFACDSSSTLVSSEDECLNNSQLVRTQKVLVGLADGALATVKLLLKVDGNDKETKEINLNSSLTPTTYEEVLFSDGEYLKSITLGGGFLGMGVQTFTGVALYTPETPYKKFSFSENTC